MDKAFVNSFFLANGKYFPSDKLSELNHDLVHSDSPEFTVGRSYRNPTLITILYWFLPLFWLFDRFFVKDVLGGLLKLIAPVIALTLYAKPIHGKLSTFSIDSKYMGMMVFVMWLLWVFLDGVTIYRRTKMANYKMLKDALGLPGYMERSTPIFAISYLVLSCILGAFIGRNEFTNSELSHRPETPAPRESTTSQEPLEPESEHESPRREYQWEDQTEQDVIDFEPAVTAQPEEIQVDDELTFDLDRAYDAFNSTPEESRGTDTGYGYSGVSGISGESNGTGRKIISTGMDVTAPRAGKVGVTVYVDENGVPREVQVFSITSEELRQPALEKTKSMRWEKKPGAGLEKISFTLEL